jgi:hypothetical protein
MEKKSLENFRAFAEDPSLKLLPPLLKSFSLFKSFGQGPRKKIMHLLQSLDLKFDLSIKRRAETLEFLAVNHFFLTHTLKVFSVKAYSIFVE